MEVTLYRAVKAFLERLGFEVKGEVRGCDVVAVRPGEPPLLTKTVRDHLIAHCPVHGRRRAN